LPINWHFTGARNILLLGNQLDLIHTSWLQSARPEQGMLDGIGSERQTGSNLGRILVGAAALAHQQNDLEAAARLIEAAYAWFEEQERKEEP
jgi:hypothetical protein